MICFVRAVEIVNLGRLNPTVITKVAQMGTGHSICNKEKNTKCVKSERKCMKVSSKKRSEQDCAGNAEEVCADCTEKAIYKEGILVGKEFAEKQKDKEIAVLNRALELRCLTECDSGCYCTVELDGRCSYDVKECFENYIQYAEKELEEQDK